MSEFERMVRVIQNGVTPPLRRELAESIAMDLQDQGFGDRLRHENVQARFACNKSGVTRENQHIFMLGLIV